MRIAVLGATGHTGKLVVRALRDRGADVIACGRNEQALAALVGPGVETRRVDVTQPASLSAAYRDADAVANLAGPFLRTGATAVRAAIEAALPYCDTTGEQAFMMATRRDFHAAAQRAGVAVINALAYEYAFADLAARARLPEGGPFLHVLYRNRGAQASAGTKKSILRVMGAPSLGYEDGQLRAIPAAKFVRPFPTAQGERTAISFPGGEILDVPRHTPFRTVRTYVPVKNPKMSQTLAPVARVLLHGPLLRAAEAYVDARHKAPRNERASGEIHLVTRDAHLVVRTPDPYVATAEICAEGILRLGKSPASGVLAPSEALPAEDILGAMARRMPDFSITPFTAKSS